MEKTNNEIVNEIGELLNELVAKALDDFDLFQINVSDLKGMIDHLDQCSDRLEAKFGGGRES